MSLVLFHGDKGGTGKSTVCKAFIDWCSRSGRPVMAIDADTRNPDVHRMFNGATPTVCINLRTEDGWAELVERMADNADTVNLALNLPAGIGDEDEKRAEIFLEAAQQVGVPIVMFWVINRGVDSVNQLRHQLDRGIASGMTKMICVRNQHFARDGERFDIWDDSKTRLIFEDQGGLSMDFPSLSERIVGTLDKNNLPYAKAFADGMFNAWDSVTLRKWIATIDTMFDACELPLVAAPALTSKKIAAIKGS